MKRQAKGSCSRHLLLSSATMVSLLATGAPTVARAIENDQKQAEASRDTELREIVVTARRRSERIQDVPIAITALDENALREKGVADGYSLLKAAPSLVANTTGTRSQISYSMRGQAPATGTTVAPVPVYFAEVPVPSDAATAPFFDLASIQILAGPQGTLFGRNSTGGAVMFTPVAPTQALEGYIDVSGGNLDYRQIEGALNIPVVPNVLALRVAGNVIRRDGFTHDLTYDQLLDNRNEQNWRVSIAFTPSEAFENQFVYDGRHLNQASSGYSLYEIDTTDPRYVQAFADAQAFGARQIASTAGRDRQLERRDGWGISNRSILRISDDVTLKNIFGYRYTKAPYFTQDADGTPLPLIGLLANVPIPVDGFSSASFPNGQKAFSDELQLAGKALDGQLDWIVGTFWSSIKEQNESNFYGTAYVGPFEIPIDGTVGNRSKNVTYAAFAQATYRFAGALDRLSATAGFRYTRDEASVTTTSLAQPTLDCRLDASLATEKCHLSFYRAFTAPTYTVGLDYKLSRRTLLYVAHRHGFKAGGVNAARLDTNLSADYQYFRPEKVDDIEIGLKSDWAIGELRGRLNVAAYHTWYKDIQRTVSFPDASFAVTNAATADISGVEVQATLIPFSGFELSGTYSYTDTKYGTYVNPFTGVDASGNHFGFIPRTKFSLSSHYSAQLPGDRGTIIPSVSYAYQTSFYFTNFTTEFPGAIAPGYGLLDARIDWTNVMGRAVDIGLFAKNLTDKIYVLNGDRGLSGIGRVFYGAPRTWGIQARIRFGDGR